MDTQNSAPEVPKPYFNEEYRQLILNRTHEVVEQKTLKSAERFLDFFSVSPVSSFLVQNVLDLSEEKFAELSIDFVFNQANRLSRERFMERRYGIENNKNRFLSREKIESDINCADAIIRVKNYVDEVSLEDWDKTKFIDKYKKLHELAFGKRVRASEMNSRELTVLGGIINLLKRDMELAPYREILNRTNDPVEFLKKTMQFDLAEVREFRVKPYGFTFFLDNKVLNSIEEVKKTANKGSIVYGSVLPDRFMDDELVGSIAIVRSLESGEENIEENLTTENIAKHEEMHMYTDKVSLNRSFSLGNIFNLLSTYPEISSLRHLDELTEFFLNKIQEEIMVRIYTGGSIEYEGEVIGFIKSEVSKSIKQAGMLMKLDRRLGSENKDLTRRFFSIVRAESKEFTTKGKALFKLSNKMLELAKSDQSGLTTETLAGLFLLLPSTVVIKSFESYIRYYEIPKSKSGIQKRQASSF